jgi:hypothetical protein
MVVGLDVYEWVLGRKLNKWTKTREGGYCVVACSSPFFYFFFGLWVCMCEYEYVYVGLWFVVRVCDWRFGLFEVMMVIVLEGDDSWCCEDGGYGGYGIIML